MSWLITQFRKEEWSPYVAGVLLGLVGILTVLLSNVLMGASGAFESLIGLAGKAVAPGLFDNMYFNFVVTSGVTWHVIMLLGAMLGGALGAWSSGTLRLRDNEDAQWIKVLGQQRWKRWLIAFLGAIVLEYGAGLAGGCTSGLAIAGGMLLAPAAFIFIASMFASGIIVMLIVYRNKY